MKKYLTLLFLVCAVALTFTGCYNSFESVGLSGDGNHSSGGTVNPGGGSDKPSGGNHSSGGTGNPGGGSSNDSLAGTTWMYEKNYEGMTLYTYTLKFTSEEKVTLEYKMMGGSSPSVTQGTYTYSNNTVTLSPDMFLSTTYESRGSVSGNKMTFKNTAAELEDLVLTKQ